MDEINRKSMRELTKCRERDHYNDELRRTIQGILAAGEKGSYRKVFKTGFSKGGDTIDPSHVVEIADYLRSQDFEVIESYDEILVSWE